MSYELRGKNQLELKEDGSIVFPLKLSRFLILFDLTWAKKKKLCATVIVPIMKREEVKGGGEQKELGREPWNPETRTSDLSHPVIFCLFVF